MDYFTQLPYTKNYKLLPHGVIMVGKVPSNKLPAMAARELDDLHKSLKKCFPTWLAGKLMPYLEPAVSVLVRNLFEDIIPTIADKAYSDACFIARRLELEGRPEDAKKMRDVWRDIDQRIIRTHSSI